MNSLRLCVALLPAVEADEALVYLEHIQGQCERIVELIDELQFASPSPHEPPAHEQPEQPATFAPPPPPPPAQPPYPA